MKTNAACESLGPNICQRMNITWKVIEGSERWRWGKREGGREGETERGREFRENLERH